MAAAACAARFCSASALSCRRSSFNFSLQAEHTQTLVPITVRSNRGPSIFRPHSAHFVPVNHSENPNVPPMHLVIQRRSHSLFQRHADQAHDLTHVYPPGGKRYSSIEGNCRSQTREELWKDSEFFRGSIL